MSDVDYAGRQKLVGFRLYWDLLGEALSIPAAQVQEWDENRIANAFERLGYIAVDLNTPDRDWPYGESPIDDLIDYMLETDMRVEGAWSGCAGVTWQKLWFREVGDAIKARLIVEG